MRIGIIHLSDLHISSKAAIHQEKVSALINSLQLLQPFEGVIIAFSGDIAGKGKSNEYLLASRLIGSLASELQSKYHVSPTNTKIILAPGNHDMNREKYRFKNKEYLAYFAAMAVSRHFNEGDASAEADLTYIIDYSCFSINSTVLKYIAYTTENIRIIELLLDQAISFVKDWTPYDIDDLQLEYLKNVAENRPRKIKGDEQKKAISAEADREKELEKKILIQLKPLIFTTTMKIL